MEAAKCWCCTSEAGQRELHGEASRDFARTLIAAGSTLFLLIAANWQLGILSGIGELASKFATRCRAMLLRTVFAIMLSFFTITISFIDVYSVWWILQKGDVFEQYEEGKLSVAAIMGTCPILIAVPPEEYWKGTECSSIGPEEYWEGTECSSIPELANIANRIGGSITSKLNEGVHPLPLSPRRQQSSASCRCTSNAHQIHQLPCTDTSYIVLAPLFAGRYSTRARLALLRLKLVPKYQELSLLRSRSRFQNGVTFLQAAGYLMGVALRLAQHRVISPLEAILSLFCIQVFLQLVGALFACSHYQRPLLLRLHPCEFFHLLKESARPVLQNEPRPARTNDSAKRRLVKNCLMYSGLVLTLFLLPAPLVYYALFIRHHCPLCFFSTLFMALLPLLSFLIICMVVWCCVRLPRPADHRVLPIWPPYSLGGLGVSVALIIIALLYFAGILLAGLATYRNWALFNTHTSTPWIKWILPHISSS